MGTGLRLQRFRPDLTLLPDGPRGVRSLGAFIRAARRLAMTGALTLALGAATTSVAAGTEVPSSDPPSPAPEPTTEPSPSPEPPPPPEPPEPSVPPAPEPSIDPPAPSSPPGSSEPVPTEDPLPSDPPVVPPDPAPSLDPPLPSTPPAPPLPGDPSISAPAPVPETDDLIEAPPTPLDDLGGDDEAAAAPQATAQFLQAAPAAVVATGWIATPAAPASSAVEAPAPAPVPAPTEKLTAAPAPSVSPLDAEGSEHARPPPPIRTDLLPVEVVAAVAGGKVVSSSVAVAVEFGRAGSGWAGTIVFNIWLRRRLRERRMTQRQLAARSGVDHSTISRLLSGDRTPSLATATKLAQALRELGENDDAIEYFERAPDAVVFPTRRVEAALLGDDDLTDDDVRQLMHAYLIARARRRRERSVGSATPGAAAVGFGPRSP